MNNGDVMGKKYPAMTDEQQEFIGQQAMFFVGTAASDGRVNISPKGLDTLRIITPNRVVWLNLTGSGNETAAHLLENDRMTIMFCAFEGRPVILRLYGSARVCHPRDAEWDGLISLFPALPGARQVIVMDIDLVHTSCGYGVPLYDLVGQRDTLVTWAEKKGDEGIRQYWKDRNEVSLDGKPSGILGEE